jgi:transposase-like protein
MSIKPGMPGRSRRRHSEEFKARLIAECQRPGISMASVAMANGINPNLLRNWVVGKGSRQRAAVPAGEGAPEEFIALPLEVPRPTVVGGEIRIELRRGATTVSINWPVSSAQECAAWLRSWLR